MTPAGKTDKEKDYKGRKHNKYSKENISKSSNLIRADFEKEIKNRVESLGDIEEIRKKGEKAKNGKEVGTNGKIRKKMSQSWDKE